MDSILNLHYDGHADVLYASFGPPRGGTGVDVSGTPVVVMVDPAGSMVGFDIVEFRALSPHRVPLLTGAVPTDQLSIPPHTPWLSLDYSGADLHIRLEQAPEEEIAIPEFALASAPGKGVDIDLSPLLAGHRTY